VTCQLITQDLQMVVVVAAAVAEVSVVVVAAAAVAKVVVSAAVAAAVAAMAELSHLRTCWKLTTLWFNLVETPPMLVVVQPPKTVL
jgi:hypothetical protein